MRGRGKPFSGLKTPMNQSPLALAPHLICHSLGSFAAFGHTLPRLESKQVCSHHTGQAEADGDEETRVCVCVPSPTFRPCCSRPAPQPLPQAESPAQTASRPVSWVWIQTCIGHLGSYGSSNSIQMLIHTSFCWLNKLDRGMGPSQHCNF